MSNERHYPNLEPCRLVLRGSHATATEPPAKLPQACLEAAHQTTVPEPYDFALEHSVLTTKEERDHEQEASKADSKEDVRKCLLTKMKSVTKADDAVCETILEDNKYNLQSSIESFFQSP